MSKPSKEAVESAYRHLDRLAEGDDPIDRLALDFDAYAQRAVEAEREACLHDLFKPPMHLRTVEYITAVEMRIRARGSK